MRQMAAFLLLTMIMCGAGSMAIPVAAAAHDGWDGQRGIDRLDIPPATNLTFPLAPMDMEVLIGAALSGADSARLDLTLDCTVGTPTTRSDVLHRGDLVSYLAPVCPTGGRRNLTITNLDPVQEARVELTTIRYAPIPLEEGTFQFRVPAGETRDKSIFILDQPMIITVRALTGDWANLWIMPLTNYSDNLDLSKDYPYTYWDGLQAGQNTSFLVQPLVDVATGDPIEQTIVIDNRFTTSEMTVWFSILPADDAVRKGAIRDAVIASMLPAVLLALALFFYFRDRGAAAEAERARVPTHPPDPPDGAPGATDAGSGSR